MKRLLCVLLTGLFALGMTGCGNQQATELMAAAVREMQQARFSCFLRAESHCMYQEGMGVLQGGVLVENLFAEGERAQLNLLSYQEIRREFNSPWSSPVTQVHQLFKRDLDIYIQDGRYYARLYDNYAQTGQTSLHGLSLYAQLRAGELPAASLSAVTVRLPDSDDLFAKVDRTTLRIRVEDGSVLAGQIGAAFAALNSSHEAEISAAAVELELDDDGLPYRLWAEFTCSRGGSHTLELKHFYYNDTTKEFSLPDNLHTY